MRNNVNQKLYNCIINVFVVKKLNFLAPQQPATVMTCCFRLLVFAATFLYAFVAIAVKRFTCLFVSHFKLFPPKNFNQMYYLI